MENGVNAQGPPPQAMDTALILQKAHWVIEKADEIGARHKFSSVTRPDSHALKLV